MKTLILQIDDDFYPALLEVLKNLPASKIRILEQETNGHSCHDSEQAMEYTLDKNQELSL